MPIKATQFRQNLYQLLDQVSLEGKILEVERNGKILRVIPPETKSKFDLLEEHHSINGDPEDVLHVDWSADWEKKNSKARQVRGGIRKAKSGRKGSEE